MSKNKLFICKYCGKEMNSGRALGGHVTKCLSNQNRTTNKGKKIQQNSNNSEFNRVRDDLFCQYCNKQYKSLNSLKNHERRCANNVNKLDCQSNINAINALKEYNKNGSWNKGLTKETDERVKRSAENISESLKGEKNPFYGKHHSKKTKRLLSKKMKEYNHLNSKRNSWAKMGWYDNIWMMSTYELAYYIYTKDLGENIVRCTDRFKYEYLNESHYYTPDFIVNNNYIEIKGYETEKDFAKYKVVNNLVVLRYNEIKPMIEYVKQKYKVSSIEELYDK